MQEWIQEVRVWSGSGMGGQEVGMSGQEVGCG